MIVKTFIHNGDDPDTMIVLEDKIRVEQLRRFKDTVKRRYKSVMIQPRFIFITFFEEMDNDEV